VTVERDTAAPSSQFSGPRPDRCPHRDQSGEGTARASGSERSIQNDRHALHLLIQLAYDVKAFHIQGGPSWVRSDRYAIEAKAPDKANPDQVRTMLRSLLADRFKLKIRGVTRTLSVYELVPARGGLKITPMKDGECLTVTAKISPNADGSREAPVLLWGDAKEDRDHAS
jgi:uncharacterized protein (TIGR03435 family)